MTRILGPWDFEASGYENASVFGEASGNNLMMHSQSNFNLNDLIYDNLSSKKKFHFVKLLAMGLTNLVPDMTNLETHLAKRCLGQPSHQPDQT